MQSYIVRYANLMCSLTKTYALEVVFCYFLFTTQFNKAIDSRLVTLDDLLHQSISNDIVYLAAAKLIAGC